MIHVSQGFTFSKAYFSRIAQEYKNFEQYRDEVMDLLKNKLLGNDILNTIEETFHDLIFSNYIGWDNDYRDPSKYTEVTPESVADIIFQRLKGSIK